MSEGTLLSESFVLALLLGGSAVFITEFIYQKSKWNNGRCPKCGDEWILSCNEAHRLTNHVRHYSCGRHFIFIDNSWVDKWKQKKQK